VLPSSPVFDTLRPQLTPDASFRLRSDGTAGIWDPRTGQCLEVAVDEAPLLQLIDGTRTLSEIAAHHARGHGFVPFTALRDLLRGLARHGLLANTEEELHAAGFTARRGRLERLCAVPVLDAACPPLLTGGIALLWVLAAWLGAQLPMEAATGWEPLWALVGISGALSVRGFARAAAVPRAGLPRRLRLTLCFGVPHLEPDGHSVVLQDRAWRALTHGAALLGSLVAALAMQSRPGALAGALVVLAADLIPFEPTSMGHLLGAIFGTTDLRDHARAYLHKRILTRVTASRFFPGEGALIANVVLSLAWFAAIIQVLFHWGVVAVLSLVSAALGAQGVEKACALLGALVLTLLMPVALLGLAFALVRALSSLRSRPQSDVGERTSGRLESAALAGIPVFASLDPPHLAALAAAVSEVRYPAGANVVREGEPGDRFFALRSGAVVVEHELPSGLTREVARLGAGDCFGETALLDRVPRTASVRALTEVTAAVLTSSDFDAVRTQLGNVDVTRLLRAAAALHKSAFFAKLPADRLSALALRLETRNVASGQTVIQAGDPGREFFLVGAGTFEVLDAGGATIGQLRPGDHFGEVALLRDVPRTATVRANQEGLLLVLAKDAFIRAMASDLTLSSRIEEHAAARAERRS
jgi:CRP-like cAMP-binding protein